MLLSNELLIPDSDSDYTCDVAKTLITFQKDKIMFFFENLSYFFTVIISMKSSNLFSQREEFRIDKSGNSNRQTTTSTWEIQVVNKFRL